MCDIRLWGARKSPIEGGVLPSTEAGVTSPAACVTAGRMWVFLIPLLALAGVTFTGATLNMATPPPVPPGARSAAPRTLPANGPLPFDPAYRQR
jgi:hypothetical protein